MTLSWALYCLVFVIGMTLYPIASKLSGGTFSGLSFALYLNIINVIVLLILSSFNQFQDLVNIKQNLFTPTSLIILCAGIGVALSDVFFQKALHFNIPSMTQTIYTILPMVLFSLVAIFVFRDGFSLQKLIGMSLAVIGVIVMVMSERNIEIK